VVEAKAEAEVKAKAEVEVKEGINYV